MFWVFWDFFSSEGVVNIFEKQWHFHTTFYSIRFEYRDNYIVFICQYLSETSISKIIPEINKTCETLIFF